MSLTTAIGAEGKLFEDGRAAPPARAGWAHPHAGGPAALGGRQGGGAFRPRTLSLLYPVAAGAAGRAAALEALMGEAAAAVDAGVNLLILSDGGHDTEHRALPALLAVWARTSTVRVAPHAHRAGHRDGGRLAGAPHGAAHRVRVAAVHPTWFSMPSPSAGREGEAAYIGALEKGLLKVMSKMGVSTLQSRGLGLFEAVGLARGLVDRHFTGTPTRLGASIRAAAARRVGGAPCARLRGARSPAACRRAPPLAPPGGAPPVELPHHRALAGRGPPGRRRPFAAYEQALDAGPELRGLLGFRRARRCPWTRWSPPRPSPAASSRARCRSAPSAPRPTRPWPSP
ncbi:MAG: glutamate synthase central domain-containing protein [bacterium]